MAGTAHIIDVQPTRDNGLSLFTIACHVPPGVGGYPADPNATSEVPNLEASDLAKLQSGELVEVVTTVNINTRADTPVKNAVIQQRWSEVAAEVKLRNEQRAEWVGVVVACE